MILFDRNVEFKNMTVPDSAFEIENVGSHFRGIHDDIRPAIAAANADSIVDLRSAFPILVTTIPTNKFPFNVHRFSESSSRRLQSR